MKQKIVIIDYHTGNILSVFKAMNQFRGIVVEVSNNPQVIESADKIILPGVGHFGKAMESLTQLSLVETLNKHVLIQKKPVLGICLGMQLMATSSEEGNCAGLNWVPGHVKRIQTTNSLRYKIPHTGWNTLKQQHRSPMLKMITPDDEFYFVHAYHFEVDDAAHALCSTSYEHEFVSGVEKAHIFGVQFHPEKSHDQGLQLFRNFINL